jgi:mRNA m6A methyltransferase non-catalytic subunit
MLVCAFLPVYHHFLSHYFLLDTDVIIWEGDPTDPTRKPPEMYSLIENFCLGVRRLEIFGRPSSLRRGWVTVLSDEHLPLKEGAIHVEGEEGGIATRWIQESWEEGIKELSGAGKPVVPMTQDIDALRPKSPVRGQSSNLPGPVITSGSQGMQNNRFSGNRSNVHPNMQMMGPQMMMPPVMSMGAHQMGMGVMDDTLMGGWNPMMAGANHLGGMQAGNLPNIGNGGGMTMNNQGMSGVNGGALGLGGMPMQLIAQMVQGAGGFSQQGLPFNGWPGNEQGGQFGMDGSGWENEGMNPGMMNGMNMGNMNMGNMGMNGMGMGQQWNGSGNF